MSKFQDQQGRNDDGSGEPIDTLRNPEDQLDLRLCWDIGDWLPALQEEWQQCISNIRELRTGGEHQWLFSQNENLSKLLSNAIGGYLILKWSCDMEQTRLARNDHTPRDPRSTQMGIERLAELDTFVEQLGNTGNQSVTALRKIAEDLRNLHTSITRALDSSKQ